MRIFPKSASMSIPGVERSKIHEMADHLPASECDTAGCRARSRRHAASLMYRPPSRNRCDKVVPKRRGKIGDRNANAVSAGRRIVEPFCRGEIETKAAGMPDRKSGAAQVFAQFGSHSLRRCFVEVARPFQREIETVSKADFFRRVRHRSSEIST